MDATSLTNSTDLSDGSPLRRVAPEGRKAARRRPPRGLNHGSKARVPGAFFRAMTELYLVKTPGATRDGLAKVLIERLAQDGISYHIRTVRRQMCGQVSSVPPEAEAMLREIVLDKLGYETEVQMERDLQQHGLAVEPNDRVPSYVAIERVVRLAELWLYLNRGRSKRYLAGRLSEDLGRKGLTLSRDYLQSMLTGKGHVVRRELLKQLLAYLKAHDIDSEEQASERARAAREAIKTSIEERKLVDAERFRKLCRLWQVKERESSSRRLAQLLCARLRERGVHMGIAHIQRTITGKSRRARLHVIRTLEDLLTEGLPEGRTIDEELEAVDWDGTRNLDLAWVRCEPIAEMAQTWLRMHPGASMRQLALEVANTVCRMGYKSSHNSIQPILGGWKKKTRGYVYRATLKQFPGSHSTHIPEEHLHGPLPCREFESGPTAGSTREHRAAGTGPRLRESRAPKSPIREAQRHAPSGRSPGFEDLAVLRAETLYGAPARQAKAEILAGAKRPLEQHRAAGTEKTRPPALDELVGAGMPGEESPTPINKRQIQSEIRRLVHAHNVIVFMNGERATPRCEASARLVAMLDRLLDHYETIDVGESGPLREGVKAYSAWPDLPQLFVNGEFVGDYDLVYFLHQDGLLEHQLGIPDHRPEETLLDAGGT